MHTPTIICQDLITPTDLLEFFQSGIVSDADIETFRTRIRGQQHGWRSVEPRSRTPRMLIFSYRTPDAPDAPTRYFEYELRDGQWHVLRWDAQEKVA